MSNVGESTATQMETILLVANIQIQVCIFTKQLHLNIRNTLLTFPTELCRVGQLLCHFVLFYRLLLFYLIS